MWPNGGLNGGINGGLNAWDRRWVKMLRNEEVCGV